MNVVCWRCSCTKVGRTVSSVGRAHLLGSIHLEEALFELLGIDVISLGALLERGGESPSDAVAMWDDPVPRQR